MNPFMKFLVENDKPTAEGVANALADALKASYPNRAKPKTEAKPTE